MAGLLTGAQIAKLLDGVIHEPTQTHAYSFDLTLKGVYQLTTSGSCDFGGSEYKIGERKPLLPSKLHPEDKYGWWELSPGSYIIHYNESINLPANKLAIIAPHPHILANGAHLPTLFFYSGSPVPETMLWVGAAGIRLKENARIAELLVVEFF